MNRGTAVLSLAISCLLLMRPAGADDLRIDARLGQPFVEQTIPIAGGQLCCIERRGDGATLMLIPGTFSDSRTFRRLVPHLDESLHLLIVENRGLGKSWPPPEDGSSERCARDALLIADRLNVDRWYVGGHSLGWMISIEVARVAPDRLRGVICIEGWTQWQAARDAFGNDMKSTLTATQLQELAAYRADVLQHWNEGQINAFAQVWKNWNCEPVLRTTNLPVLELYGDRGKPPASRAQLRVPDRDNIALEWFAGASHSLPFERPQQVADAINRFIARCEQSGQ